MKHLIMGTAGHIDHGKTTLIKALTGFDCDTHREERLRGITINLGFTHLDLSSGESIGIVDVPGHADFVNTMVAGASGIDFVMLVVAADAGVMPQTIEHLKIMDILGIKQGIIVLSKTDLVDDILLEMAIDEVRESVQGTFLENAEILPVSARSGSGIDELLQKLGEIEAKMPQRARGEVFRMFIDRIFTAPGFGTVVNGSIQSGSIHKNEKVYLLPPAKELRIRRIEKHGHEVEEVTSGDRASFNLTGLSKEDFERGMLISDRVLQSTHLIDAKLKLFDHNRRFDIWTQVIFLLGTYRSQARIHLMDSNKLEAGESAIVQIHLEKPLIAQYADNFVIRSSSSDITLGGGEIIDVHPLHHRRRPEKLIKSLRQVVDGDLPELIAAEIRKRISPVSHQYIADILNISFQKVLEIVAQELPQDIIAMPSKDKDIVYLMKNEDRQKWEDKILRHLKTYHKRNPMDDKGRTFEELIGLFGVNRNSTTESILRLILDELTAQKKLKRVEHTWARADHEVELSEQEKQQVDFVE
ncbi:MAG: selenocysteine-specific translation elongation factor, partial [Candidatus Cloacimonadota bacterium]|nr:selenocysteine-specific translation elongation factor [Candidatus Cloacimonadota bacterium]